MSGGGGSDVCVDDEDADPEGSPAIEDVIPPRRRVESGLGSL
jgi:hypothetical protein|tara:strand:+ start:317 stop:442 length:126 start_codon:yes stop_codon:yes gene_type:complete